MLSDVVMEGAVGTALLEAIRAIPGRYLTRVIFMSSMPERRVRSLIEGDYAFLHKPFTRDELAAAVQLTAYRGLVGPRESRQHL